MKNHSCEKEQQVAAAVCFGALTEDLKEHVAVCEVCAEVMLVAGLLCQEIVPETANLNPPDAAVIWRRAQDSARRKALAKATAPIRIARICALVVALVAIPWLFTSVSWYPNLGLQPLGMIDRAVSQTLTPVTLLSLGASLIFMLLSSWYVLRQE